MNQNSAVELLLEIQKLMELRGENPFKVKAYDKAVQVLAGRDDLQSRAKNGTLTELPGIGKGIAEVLTEFLIQGHSTARDEMIRSVPPGMIELTSISGLGPKKAKVLIDELGIQTLGELEYACKENRLLKLKGFGPKIQQKLLDEISNRQAFQGFQKISDAFPWAEGFYQNLQSALPNVRVSETGALRRRCEILNRLDFLIELKSDENVREKAETVLSRMSLVQVLPVQLFYAPSHRFGYELAKTTATDEHWKAIGNPLPFEAQTEEEFYQTIDLPWMPPETRETGEEVSLARQGKLDTLLSWNGLRGVFHNHTTRSDGSATLSEMVLEAENLGFDYIGISDHSQSAFYAQGLMPTVLLEQEKEIRTLQEKHPKIRIFWGIESDILADGSLDYEESILKRFDFVIASVHSRFQMDRTTMTQRIVEAIRNPYTRFLGHPTGRLLLGRKGYEVDMEKVIEEASKNQVAIELNSNPARLDFDWRLGKEMRKYNAFTSINPDAHETEGLKDTRFGIAMARKAMIPVDRVVNSRSTQEVEKWLKRS